MSWYNDIYTIDFEIITGDKKAWYPKLTQNYVKNVEYNGTQYDFINRAGSYFARKLPKGRSYPLEFAFTGENNVKNANSFEKSARDMRVWTVTHPFYGKMSAQPLSLEANSSGFDCTIIKCQVIETIVANQPKERPDYSDLVEQKKQIVNQKALTALNPIAGGLPIRNTKYALAVTNNISSRISKITKLENEYKEFQKNAKNAINELNVATGITQGYIAAAQKLITTPAIVASDIGSRWQVLSSSMEYLGQNLKGMARVGYFEKLFYNLMGCTVISAMSTAVITKNNGDLQTRNDVLVYIEKYKYEYNSFLSELYSIEDKEFIPDHDLMFSLHLLVNETISLMYQILFESKQERIHYPKKDTNIILLTHRLYGLASEENLAYLKSTNNIGISEILCVKKDRPIKYYV